MFTSKIILGVFLVSGIVFLFVVLSAKNALDGWSYCAPDECFEVSHYEHEVYELSQRIQRFMNSSDLPEYLDHMDYGYTSDLPVNPRAVRGGTNRVGYARIVCPQSICQDTYHENGPFFITVENHPVYIVWSKDEIVTESYIPFFRATYREVVTIVTIDQLDQQTVDFLGTQLNSKTLLAFQSNDVSSQPIGFLGGYTVDVNVQCFLFLCHRSQSAINRVIQ